MRPDCLPKSLRVHSKLRVEHLRAESSDVLCFRHRCTRRFVCLHRCCYYACWVQKNPMPLWLIAVSFASKAPAISRGHRVNCSLVNLGTNPLPDRAESHLFSRLAAPDSLTRYDITAARAHECETRLLHVSLQSQIGIRLVDDVGLLRESSFAMFCIQSKAPLPSPSTWHVPLPFCLKPRSPYRLQSLLCSFVISPTPLVHCRAGCPHSPNN